MYTSLSERVGEFKSLGRERNQASLGMQNYLVMKGFQFLGELWSMKSELHILTVCSERDFRLRSLVNNKFRASIQDSLRDLLMTALTGLSLKVFELSSIIPLSFYPCFHHVSAHDRQSSSSTVL